MKQAFVTGAAGFIGSHLVDCLLERGVRVVGWDNFSTGQPEFLRLALKSDGFRLIEGDNLDFPALETAMAGCDAVFHLAANADVRFGTHHPRKDLEQNTIATSHVLEAMRSKGISRIAFASTGSIYGEGDLFPTPEDAPFPVQTSLYGASKLACEGLIQAYCEGFGFEGTIFRFVSNLGERYTHGHVLDFYRQLREHPEQLHVLGDGNQKKSYIYVKDCVEAMLHVVFKGAAALAKHRVGIFNLGTPEYCTVNESIQWICGHLGLSPEIHYSGEKRGWVGDSPFIFLDISRIQSLGWIPKVKVKEAIAKTLDWLSNNTWVLEKR